MKKILTLTLALILCLGLVACGTEPEKLEINTACVGEWIGYTGIDTGYGVKDVKTVTLTLNEDGSALYGSTKGTWCYFQDGNEVIVDLPEDGMNFFVEQIDGHTVLEVFGGEFYGSFFREEKDSYAAAYDRIMREWYTTSGDVLSFQEGGAIILNGEVLESKWSIRCLGPYIVLDYGGERPQMIKLNVTSQYDTYLQLNLNEKLFEFYSSEYTTLITVDNWTENFSSNLEDVFDISYEIEYKTNEWGEPTGCEVYQKFALKDEQYSNNSVLTVEAACGTDAQKFWLDQETQSVLQERVSESPQNGEKITFDLDTRFERHLYADGVEYHIASGEIVRKKGLLFKAGFDLLRLE